MNNILVWGEGYIGKKIQKHLNCQITGQKINRYQDIEQVIARYKPKIIINAIGYTGYPNVDGCENNIDTSLSANAFIPIMLAEAAIRHNIKLVHLSSGCIYHYDYNESKPIIESAEPDFFDLFYSRTKIYAERILTSQAFNKKVLIIRIRIPLDDEPNPKNILDKLIRYKKIIDIPNSVTYIPDLLAAIKHLINVKASGVYNAVNAGGLRYPKLLDIYRRYRPDFDYEIVKLKDVLKAPRTNLIMSTKKLAGTGFKVRKIDDILENCVKKYVQNQQ